MKNYKVLLFLLSSILLVHPTSHAGSPAREPFELFKPSNIEPNSRSNAPSEKLPLVVLLHGYLGSSSLIDFYFNYSNQVETRRFLLVVPNGLKNSQARRYWNATDACCDFEHSNVDDVAYLRSVISEVKLKYPVDETRVFIVGHSNGGFMAYRMACEASDLITGVVSFAGVNASDMSSCRPPKPISVLQIHAIDDDTIHFSGDSVGYPPLKGYPSAQQTFSDWAEREGCQGSIIDPVRLHFLSLVWNNDTFKTVAQKCKHGTSVELLTIEALNNPIHTPHTPLLRQEFTDTTLDFVFTHPRR